jgi:hypothetical protein
MDYGQLPDERRRSPTDDALCVCQPCAFYENQHPQGNHEGWNITLGNQQAICQTDEQANSQADQDS